MDRPSVASNVLLATLNESTEETIWSAVRALQEGAMLLQHLAEHARDAGQSIEARGLEREVQDKLEHADVVRESLRRSTEREQERAT